MRHIANVLLLVLLILAPAQALAKKALFDNTKNETAGQGDWIIDTDQPVPSPAQSGITAGTSESYWLGGISAWGVAMVKRGYTVHTLTSSYGITYGNTGNPYDLSNYDVFIIPEPQNPFSAAETTAIFAFLRNGGGIVAVGDHNASDRDNDGYDSPKIYNALDPNHVLGVHWGISGDSNNNISQISTNVATSATDSIIHGPAGTVTNLSFHNGNTLTLYPAANPTVRGEVWMNGASQSGTTQAMAASAVYGNGRIVYVCDSSPMDDGSGQSGNTLYTGWSETGTTDSTVFMNAALWVSRRDATGDTTDPVVSVTAPAASATWACAASRNITWTATDNVAVTTVDLEYSLNNGSSYTAIASGIANSGTYAWTVPNSPSTQARIRVTAHDAAANTGTGVSGQFTIADQTSPVVSVTAPAASATWACAASRNITWTATDNVAVTTVDLEYSLNNGSSYTAIASGIANSGTYAWTVPNSPSTQARIRVTAHDAAANTGTGVSGQFTIADQTSPVVSVTAPAASATWACAASRNITWTATDNVAVTTVDLEYSLNNGSSYTAIASGITNSGTYAWTVPNSPSTQARIRVTAHDAAANTGTGVSGQFTIADQTSPVVAVTAPAASASWPAGASRSITWTATDNVAVTTVDLEYSINNGSSFATIASGIANSGSYGWNVPNAPSTQARIRVTAHDAAANAGADVSGQFIISDQSSPTAHLVTPNGGEVWVQGTTHSVQWTSADNVAVDSVNLDYSMHGADGPWLAILHGAAANGTYSWILPPDTSDSVLVRATAFDNSLNQGSDMSDSLLRVWTGTVSVANGGHAVLALSRPSPNPSNSTVLMRYSLPASGQVQLEVLDVTGRRVWALEAADQAAGDHAVVWNGRTAAGQPASAGLYFVRLIAATGARTERLVRMK